MIRLAKEKDLDNIQEIYVYARKFMAEHGNPTQWGQTRPTEETLRKDIEKEQANAKKELQSQIMDIAMLAAKKIIMTGDQYDAKSGK